MTEITEKTPMVIPIMVRAARSLFAPSDAKAILIISVNNIVKNSNIEYRNPKQTVQKSEMLVNKQSHYSHLRRMAPKIFISSLASCESCWRSCSRLPSTSSKRSQ